MPPPTPTENHPLDERVRALAEETVAGTDLYVVDVAVRGREGNRVVEVFLDADRGADLQAIAAASRRLGFLLDTEDLIPGRYTLNVSSPGADRPLALPRQYLQHLGRLLAVRFAREGEEATVQGVLRRADADALLLEPPEGGPVEIPFDAVREGRVVLPW